MDSILPFSYCSINFFKCFRYFLCLFRSLSDIILDLTKFLSNSYFLSLMINLLTLSASCGDCIIIANSFIGATTIIYINIKLNKIKYTVAHIATIMILNLKSNVSSVMNLSTADCKTCSVLSMYYATIIMRFVSSIILVLWISRVVSGLKAWAWNRYIFVTDSL